ncbi:MAG: elongation factor Ts [Acidimicrobiia bacterium]
MTASAEEVQRLRRTTGVGMMDAKRALEATEGDFDGAIKLLREQGLAEAGQRSARAANQGTIGYYLHPNPDYPAVGVLVELASETDFVARSPEFQDLAHQLALHIAARRPRWVSVEEVPASEIADEEEVIRNQATNEGKPDEVIPKIVEGRMRSFYQDEVLYEQPFVNEERFGGTVGEMVQQTAVQMGENVGVKRFARLAVGETTN